MSARMSGSPPVRMRIGSVMLAMSSMTSLHCARLSSPGYGSQCAAARQCAQARLQLRVISQAMMLGALMPVRASYACAA